MKSSIFYLPKEYNLITQEEIQSRIYHDLWQVGPFRVPKNIFSNPDFSPDFSSEENIFKDFLQEEKKYYYYNEKKDCIIINLKYFDKIIQSLKIVNDNILNEPIKRIKRNIRNSNLTPLDKLYFYFSDKCISSNLAPLKKFILCFFVIYLQNFNIFFYDNQYGLLEKIDKKELLFLKKLKNYNTEDELNKLANILEQELVFKNIILEQELVFKNDIVQIPFENFVDVKKYRAQKNDFKNQSLLFLLEADRIRAQLPELEKTILKDSSLGHWDLFWPEGTSPDSRWYASIHTNEEAQGRDPSNDIRKAAVAIDFGTTSTVVAMRGNKGQIILLRIGLQNMQQAPQPQHYENPTVLNFDDATSLLTSWQAAPYRPFVRWQDVQCSHQARAEFADKTESGMRGLKTWARGKCDDIPLRILDQQGIEIELPIPAASMQEIEADFQKAQLNPIELYAFFLGLNLNNQLDHGGRIFCQYYMTFPVKFDRETRDRILNSFARGLKRSLPPSLVYGKNWDENRFFVQEHANEPTAYAAAVLPLLPENEEADAQPLRPTEEGVPFGVFDFGGGTTDFAFGLYRKPTAEEAGDNGWEEVLDILDSSGDENLGGEHLVHHLAYDVIQKNCDLFLKESISFVEPVDARYFAGSEGIFANSIIARSNTVKLCEKLRPLWEENSFSSEEEETGQITETFLTAGGKRVENLPIAIDIENLNQLLKSRIQKGVESFFATFRQAFKKYGMQPQCLHILLAGNSCKSPFVLEAFETKRKEILSGPHSKDKIIIHPPLQPDKNKPEGVTLKTGVAIGLLKTLDTEPTGVVVRHTGEETAFRFCVGSLVEGKLKPVLIRNAAYQEWKTFGKVFKTGKTKVLYTLSPLAIEEMVERGEDCYEEILDWGQEYFGKTIMIQATSPDSVTFGLADEKGHIIQETEKTLHLQV